MGFQQVPDGVWKLGDANATHAYVVTRSFSDWRTGQIGASLDVIAEAAGWSVKTLRRAFDALRAAGWLALEGEHGRQRWRIIPPSAELVDSRVHGTGPTPPTDGSVPSVDHASDAASTPPVAVPLAPAPARQNAEKQAAPQYDQADPDQAVLPGLPGDADQIRSRRQAKARTMAEDVERVIAAFEEASGSPGHSRDQALNTAVVSAIRVAGVDKVVRAVRGIWRDDWWAARGPSLTQAIRNAETIERFAAKCPEPRDDWQAAVARWDELRIEGIALINAAPVVPTDQKFACAVEGVRTIPIPSASGVPDSLTVPRFEDAALNMFAVDLGASLRAVRAVLADPATSPRARSEVVFSHQLVVQHFDEVLRKTRERDARMADEQTQEVIA